jgi:hypothetical protein
MVLNILTMGCFDCRDLRIFGFQDIKDKFCKKKKDIKDKYLETKFTEFNILYW